jgi:hypothetical protein
VLREGARSGVVLGVCAVALALLGLTPASTWIPEVPLLAAAIIVPVAILGWTGWRVASRSGQLFASPLVGAVAGTIGGAVAGIAFVIAGKPAVNVVVGILGGALAGAALSFAGAVAQLNKRRRSAQR